MQREEIAKGVFYTSFEGGYKKNRLSIHLKTPLARKDITETALLPYLLERGSEKFPDMTAIKRRLNMLYGASLYTSAMSLDYARILSLTLDGIDEKYLETSESVATGRVDLLLDMLFHPLVKDGAFNNEWLDIEREKLRVNIQSEINDKRAYCLKKASERFFGDDERALPQNGFVEDLDGIDGRRLYDVYREILESSTVEIINIGSDDDKAKKRLIEAFSGISRDPQQIKDKRAMPYSAEEDDTLFFDVEQDKYAMIYTAGRLLSEREQSVFRVANLIFGSSPTSRLFMNVREKESLCYYCASRPGFMTGSLTVDSGVEKENVEKLKSAVNRELADLAAGNITDKELDEAKLMLKNALTGVEDSVEGLGGWYLNSIYRLGRAVSPQEEIENIQSVTKGEIASLFSLFKMKVTMLLTGKEA